MGAGGLTFSTWGGFSKGVRGVRLDFQLGEVFQRAFVELGWIFNLGRFWRVDFWAPYAGRVDFWAPYAGRVDF